MSHYHLPWEHTLRTAGYRITKQREAVLDAVCTGGGHKTIDAIFAAVRAQDSCVDRSTIYRTLRTFIQVGLVVEAREPGGETTYEIKQLAPHHHLVCQSCRSESEIPDTAIATLVTTIAEHHGFHLSNDHLVLYGTCAKCAQALAPGPGAKREPLRTCQLRGAGD